MSDDDFCDHLFTPRPRGPPLSARRHLQVRAGGLGHSVSMPTVGGAFVWEFKGSGARWHAFPADSAAVVESAYPMRMQTPDIHLNIRGQAYVLNFQNMQQRRLDDPTATRRVRRTPQQRQLHPQHQHYQQQHQQPRQLQHPHSGPAAAAEDASWGSTDSTAAAGTTASSAVVWEHSRDRGRNWHPFSPSASGVVEGASLAGALAVRLDIDREAYEIDLAELRQYCVAQPHRTRHVRRNGPTAAAGPPHGGTVTSSAVPGVRVQRGADWNSGDEDGGAGGIGTVAECDEDATQLLFDSVAEGEDISAKLLFVRWDTGSEGHYRVFDLAMAPRLPCYWSQPSQPFAVVTCPQVVVQQVQKMFDQTWASVATRDRQKRTGLSRVPQRFIVSEVLRNQNAPLWFNYADRLMELQSMREQDASAKWKWKPEWPQVKTHKTFPEAYSLKERCNEVYLMHGTTENAAQAILKNNFSLSFVQNGLLGPVFCLAESVTKADEYSPAVDEHTMVVCRVALGRIHYTAEVQPDKRVLGNILNDGTCHGVLADRQGTSGYREFAVANPLHMFPEYLVRYRRQW